MEQLGPSLREARLRKGISQEELAERLAVSPTHLKHIESGHRKPSIEVFLSMTEILDFSTDQFVFSRDKTEFASKRAELSNMLETCSERQLDVVRATAQALLRAYPASSVGEKNR